MKVKLNSMATAEKQEGVRKSPSEEVKFVMKGNIRVYLPMILSKFVEILAEITKRLLIHAGMEVLELESITVQNGKSDDEKKLVRK